MYESDDPGAEIKLIDFGLSNRYNQLMTMSMSSMVGTRNYLSPDVIRGKNYGPACDIWSIGIIMYILLCGNFPFDDRDGRLIFRKILDDEIDLTADIWGEFSANSKDLLNKLLNKEAETRITAS
jgi:calcium-dependent protein kinase